jgi:undecaprenyl-diphosphatase
MQLWKKASHALNRDAWPLYGFLTVAALLLVFGHIAEEVIEGDSAAFDRNILLALRVSGGPSTPIGPIWLQEAARDLTALGSVLVLSLLTASAAGYLFLVRRHATALFVVTSVLAGYLFNNLLKFGFDRPRPDYVTPLVRIYSGSFPSGHAALSAIAYLTLATILARAQPLRSVRLYFMGIALGLTLLVGLSRVYLGVHYLTDVLAGWCLGCAWALGARILADRWHLK